MILENLDGKALEKLEKFYEIHMAAKLNLTSIKDKDEFYLKHYLDSIYYFQQHMQPPVGRLADIGSGGGFPGIVLAICYPELNVTLIESIKKKCDFLTDAVKLLQPSNIRIINSRAEDVKRDTFEIITARGVTDVKKILEFSWNLSRKNTKWILYKGEKLQEELKDARSFIRTRGVLVEQIRVETPFTRTYCIISR